MFAIADKTQIVLGENGQTYEAKIAAKWSVTGDGSLLDSYNDNAAKWTSSNMKVATVENGIVTGLSKGSTKITAEITIGNRAYKSTITVKVLENRKPAEITVDAITVNNSLVEADGSIYTVDLSNNKDNKGSIIVKLENASKLTVKNSNTNIVKTFAAKAVANEKGTYEIPVKLLAGGMSKITLTANDVFKTTKEIWLIVKDAAPYMDVSTLMINKLQSMDTSFVIHPSREYAVTDILLGGADADKFEFSPVKANDTFTGKCVLSAKAETAISDNYNVTVVVIANGMTYEFPITVKVTEDMPKVTAKQSGKINLFYKYSKAELKLTTAETIESIALTGACAENYEVVLDEETGKYFVQTTNEFVDVDAEKSGNLEICLKGWDQPLRINYAVGVEKKVPKLTLTSKSGIFSPAYGMNRVETSILVDGETVDLTGAVNVLNPEDMKGYRMETVKNQLSFVRESDDAGDATIQLKVQDGGWKEPVTLSYTVTVDGKKPAIKLSKRTLQLNANEETSGFDMAVAQVLLSDGRELTSDMSVEVEPANAKAINAIDKGLEVKTADSQITAKSDNAGIAKGTYKFNVFVKYHDEYMAKTILNIKVANAVAKKSIQLSTKGKIDVLNRNGSCVTVTPKLRTVNGKIVDVSLRGKNAGLFKTDVVDGIIQIHLKENVKVITKYNYCVNLNLTIQNEDGEQMTVIMDETKINLKQGNAKLTKVPSSGTLYSNADSVTITNLKATLAGASAPAISKIELVNYKNMFEYEYDKETRDLTIKATDEAAKGKSYSLQFEVTLQGKAYNVKPLVLKYTVKVK